MSSPTPSPDEHPAARFGPVAISEYDAARESTKPRLAAYLSTLYALTDDELFAAARIAIIDDAISGNFPGNYEHLYCRTTAVYAEARLRHVAAGHDGDCPAPTIYSRAHDAVMRENGHTPSKPSPCPCRLSEEG